MDKTSIRGWAAALGRFFRTPIGLGTVLTFILAINVWDPIGDWMRGEITLNGAAAQTWSDLSHFVNNPLVRILFALLTIWLIALGVHRIIEADDARAAVDEARAAAQIAADEARVAAQAEARSRDMEEIKNKLEQLAQEHQAQLDAALAATKRLNEPMARELVLRRRLEEMQPHFRDVSQAVGHYTAFVKQMDEGHIDPRVLHSELERHKGAVLSAIHAAHFLMAGERWTDILDLPNANIGVEQDQNGNARSVFRPENNRAFLHAHFDASTRLTSVVQGYALKITEVQQEANEAREKWLEEAKAVHENR